ncbi:hypothetical protein QJS10_CPB22g00322 [Acorus calamus]|uniref:Uncharacterized protein n=1 Tax=Acorus calamus TaxID=4465 RepID=A0AAV9C151_ACOCL|nr:hypothetical protein QJS10_CPB22g00322 [Acorus calamus]
MAQTMQGATEKAPKAVGQATQVWTEFAARKAHNTLNTVILPDGRKIEDQRQIQHYTIEYYKDLLNKESDQPIPPFSSSTRLDDGDNAK